MGFIRISRAALEDRRRGRVLGWGSDFGGGTGGPRSRPWTPTPFSSLYLRARAKGARNALEVPGQLRHSARVGSRTSTTLRHQDRFSDMRG